VVLAGSFWWKSIISLSDECRSITKCEVGNGSSVLFWSDLWKDDLLDSSFPRLFSYAKDKLQSVKEFFDMESVLESFHLPLSVQPHDELASLQLLLHNTSLNSESNDSWIFKLGNKGFRSRKFTGRLLPILILTNPLVGSRKVNAYPSTIFLPG
jgi:hypothetical protein